MPTLSIHSVAKYTLFADACQVQAYPPHTGCTTIWLTLTYNLNRRYGGRE